MKKAVYTAVFEPSATGGYGVYFPDLPGCTSMGDTYAEALSNAEEALGLHLWGMADDGDTIPEPTYPPYADVPEGALYVSVIVYPDLVKREMDNRAIRTNVSIPAWLKSASEAAGLNYSQVLQAALIDCLNARPQNRA